MKLTKKKGYLAASGVILIAIGTYISLSPAEYLGQFGMGVTDNINFYSDLRSMVGSLLVFGLVAMTGAFRKRFEESATLMSTIVFVAYGIFRITAIAIDGIPGGVILGATAIEIVFALIGLALISSSQKALVTA
ncbi:MAG: DUF4345 domain-containing protein [Bdellovibrionales bacterium]|nr:DUF4345 domain-containing protein [Bdellovibrionales bacterium]NQZ18241.1 DUF4345 domain-containing protein [Bdellovibrionales bacterium]